MTSRVRIATLAIAVLVFTAAVLPCCASACCVQKDSATRMMAAMKCCNHTPTVRSSPSPFDHPDLKLTDVAKVSQPAATSNVVAVSEVRPIEVARIGVDLLDSAPAPSAFLRNEQFRI